MKLYEHQQKIIDESPNKTGLFLGTGSGKTRVSLLLARGKTLVICPKTQFEDRNWEREADAIGFLNEKRNSLTVISKERFRKDAEILETYDTVIVDEAHTVLGATPSLRWVKKRPIPKTSQLYQALEFYLQRTKPTKLYLVTATIIRSPMSVWAAGRLLGNDWDFYKWREAFYIRLPMPGREVWTAKKDSTTKDRLAKIVRSIGYTGRLEDYFDVPDQTYKTMFLELTQEQKDAIRELPMEYPDPLVLLGKTHQIEQGILSGDEFNAPKIFSNNKIDTILNLALEFPRMVIFVKYSAQIAHIASALKDMGYKVLRLEGATKDRGEVIREANESQECIFIAQSQVSSGWELPDFPVMVFASLDWSIVNKIQSEGRILRANKLKKNLYISLVVKGGVDEAVYNAIENKNDFNERIYLGI